jgi:hypothetical protein
MKIITIFNFPNQENYNNLCQWWVAQCLKNSELDIEIWHRDSVNHLQFVNERVKFIEKSEIEISRLLKPNLISDKAQHNIGFKLYNLCQESKPFIFIDADAILLKDINPIINASKCKPFIAIDHQVIPGHTSHIPYRFLNSGVQICSDPSILDLDEIVKIQNLHDNFVVPGTDQSMIWTYFKHIKYDYSHPKIDWKWNNCAGLIKDLNDIAINHYWYNFKPWIINCSLWRKFCLKL